MPTLDTLPWLDIPNWPLLTAGNRERDAPSDEGRSQTSDTLVRPLSREAAPRTATPSGRPLRRRNNGLA